MLLSGTVLLSGGNRFSVSQRDGRVCIWRAQCTRFQNENIVQVQPFGSGGVMVWAGISALRKTLPVVIQGNMSSKLNLHNILRNLVLPMMAGTFNIPPRHQDDALSELCYNLSGILGTTQLQCLALDRKVSRLIPDRRHLGLFVTSPGIPKTCRRWRHFLSKNGTIMFLK